MCNMFPIKSLLLTTITGFLLMASFCPVQAQIFNRTNITQEFDLANLTKKFIDSNYTPMFYNGTQVPIIDNSSLPLHTDLLNDRLSQVVMATAATVTSNKFVGFAPGVMLLLGVILYNTGQIKDYITIVRNFLAQFPTSTIIFVVAVALIVLSVIVYTVYQYLQPFLAPVIAVTGQIFNVIRNVTDIGALYDADPLKIINTNVSKFTLFAHTLLNFIIFTIYIANFALTYYILMPFAPTVLNYIRDSRTTFLFLFFIYFILDKSFGISLKRISLQTIHKYTFGIKPVASVIYVLLSLVNSLVTFITVLGISVNLSYFEFYQHANFFVYLQLILLFLGAIADIPSIYHRFKMGQPIDRVAVSGSLFGLVMYLRSCSILTETELTLVIFSSLLQVMMYIHSIEIGTYSYKTVNIGGNLAQQLQGYKLTKNPTISVPYSTFSIAPDRWHTTLSTYIDNYLTYLSSTFLDNISKNLNLVMSSPNPVIPDFYASDTHVLGHDFGGQPYILERGYLSTDNLQNKERAVFTRPPLNRNSSVLFAKALANEASHVSGMYSKLQNELQANTEYPLAVLNSDKVFFMQSLQNVISFLKFLIALSCAINIPLTLFMPDLKYMIAMSHILLIGTYSIAQMLVIISEISYFNSDFNIYMIIGNFVKTAVIFAINVFLSLSVLHIKADETLSILLLQSLLLLYNLIPFYGDFMIYLIGKDKDPTQETAFKKLLIKIFSLVSAEMQRPSTLPPYNIAFAPDLAPMPLVSIAPNANTGANAYTGEQIELVSNPLLGPGRGIVRPNVVDPELRHIIYQKQPYLHVTADRGHALTLVDPAPMYVPNNLLHYPADYVLDGGVGPAIAIIKHINNEVINSIETNAGLKGMRPFVNLVNPATYVAMAPNYTILPYRTVKDELADQIYLGYPVSQLDRTTLIRHIDALDLPEMPTAVVHPDNIILHFHAISANMSPMHMKRFIDGVARFIDDRANPRCIITPAYNAIQQEAREMHTYSMIALYAKLKAVVRRTTHMLVDWAYEYPANNPSLPYNPIPFALRAPAPFAGRAVAGVPPLNPAQLGCMGDRYDAAQLAEMLTLVATAPPMPPVPGAYRPSLYTTIPILSVLNAPGASPIADGFILINPVVGGVNPRDTRAAAVKELSNDGMKQVIYKTADDLFNQEDDIYALQSAYTNVLYSPITNKSITTAADSIVGIFPALVGFVYSTIHKVSKDTTPPISLLQLGKVDKLQELVVPHIKFAKDNAELLEKVRSIESKNKELSEQMDSGFYTKLYLGIAAIGGLLGTLFVSMSNRTKTDTGIVSSKMPQMPTLAETQTRPTSNFRNIVITISILLLILAILFALAYYYEYFK